MATKYFLHNITSCLSRARFTSKTTFKSFHHIYNRSFLTVNSVGINKCTDRLVLKWQDNLTDEYPLVWLRDNCQCPSCFDYSSQSRTINFTDLKVKQKSETLILHNNEVEVHWEDGHKSAFSLEWLKQRSFRREEQEKWLHDNKAPYKTWEALDFEKIPQFDFSSILKCDSTLLEWLHTLDVWGVCRIENTPNSLGHVKTLAERVAFIKKTHYGEEYSVQAKASATNVAYTQGYLQLHTDLPYYEYKPGINLLHCYIQYKGVGGDSLLTDGFRIAEFLRANDPSTYKYLTDTMVSWSDIGQENGNHFHKINHAPVICESTNGTIRRINFSQPQRDSHMAVPIEQVEQWYRALKVFHSLALDPRYLVEFKMNPGQMITFDNLRVLHGRTGFGQGLKGERHVQGAYLDWDEARSRIRVLKAKLQKDKN